MTFEWPGALKRRWILHQKSFNKEKLNEFCSQVSRCQSVKSRPFLFLGFKMLKSVRQKRFPNAWSIKKEKWTHFSLRNSFHLHIFDVLRPHHFLLLLRHLHLLFGFFRHVNSILSTSHKKESCALNATTTEIKRRDLRQDILSVQ